MSDPWAEHKAFFRRLAAGELAFDDLTPAQRDILRELAVKVDYGFSEGVPATSAEAARNARLLREIDEEAATRARALLHEQVAEGNEYAAEVLDLLSDEPWWLENPEGVEPWRPPE